MKIITSFLAAVLALLVILFAVSNRAPVQLQIWPFPFEVTLGVYAVALLAVLVGFVIGVVAAWLMGAERRRELRRRRKQVRDLEESLARYKDSAAQR